MSLIRRSRTRLWLRDLSERWQHWWSRLRGDNSQRTPNLTTLFDRIGIVPVRTDLYLLAMRHRSCSIIGEEGEKLNNERLEFLGDAVLEASICTYLYHLHPTWDEGELSKCKSSLVSRPVNNEVGRRLHLERYIVMVPSALDNSVDIYGNTVEALIGAIYLDQGYARTQEFVRDFILPTYRDMQEHTVASIQNYKSELIEWVQKHHLSHEFRLEEHEMAPHDRFVYSVWIDGKPVGRGSGSSKKRAQQEASRATLDLLQQAYSTIQRRGS